MPKDINRAGCPDLITPADWCESEKDAEGVARGPVPKIPDLDHFTRTILLTQMHRDIEVNLVPPCISTPFDG